MDFRDYAAKETSASLHRLFAGSVETSRQQLDVLRAAFDAATKALESAGPSPDAERDIAELVNRLTQAATATAEQAEKRVADKAQKVNDSLRAELQARVEEKNALAASVNEAHAQSEALRGELKTATQQADATRHELAQARTALEKLEAARLELTAARDDEARNRTSAEHELQKTRESLDAIRIESAAATKKLELTVSEKTTLEDVLSVARSQAEAAEAKLHAVTDLFKASAARVTILERGQRDQERSIRELEARPHASPAAGGTPTASVSLFEELLGGFQALGTARTITEVLTTLTEQLAAQFPRVALFRVKTNHLQGEHQIGFDLKTDIGKVVMPLGMDSLLTRAAGSGRIERLSDPELVDSSRAPFSGTPSCALALPILVGDDTLAVIYADDSGAAADDRGPDAVDVSVRFADAMLQHAVALLMRLTTELKAISELRAYATSLLQEIEQMYVSDVAAGKASQELQSRLKANLEYARSIYTNRVALEGADAAALLDDQLAAVIETQHATPFGRDLAVIAGRADLGAHKHRAAEAS